MSWQRIFDILKEAGIELKLAPPRKGGKPKDENIRILEHYLNEMIKGNMTNNEAVRILEQHGFTMFDENDYYKLLSNENARPLLEPDYKHSRRFLCSGMDWHRFGDVYSGSLCIWKKDGRYYYCKGVIIYKGNRPVETTVICEQIM